MKKLSLFIILVLLPLLTLNLTACGEKETQKTSLVDENCLGSASKPYNFDSKYLKEHLDEQAGQVDVKGITVKIDNKSGGTDSIDRNLGGQIQPGYKLKLNLTETSDDTTGVKLTDVTIVGEISACDIATPTVIVRPTEAFLVPGPTSAPIPGPTSTPVPTPTLDAINNIPYCNGDSCWEFVNENNPSSCEIHWLGPINGIEDVSQDTHGRAYEAMGRGCTAVFGPMTKPGRIFACDMILNGNYVQPQCYIEAGYPNGYPVQAGQVFRIKTRTGNNYGFRWKAS